MYIQKSGWRCWEIDSSGTWIIMSNASSYSLNSFMQSFLTLFQQFCLLVTVSIVFTFTEISQHDNIYMYTKYLTFSYYIITPNLLHFWNGIICLPFLELSVIIHRDIKMKTWSWSATSIKPGQSACMCILAWLYPDGKHLNHFQFTWIKCCSCLSSFYQIWKCNKHFLSQFR